MGKQGYKTTTSGMEWNAMLGLTQRLKQDGNYRFYLLITLGCYFGLRAGDLLGLRWCDLVDADEVHIKEQKTAKARKVTINPAVKQTLVEVKDILSRRGHFDEDGYIFAN